MLNWIVETGEVTGWEFARNGVLARITRFGGLYFVQYGSESRNIEFMVWYDSLDEAKRVVEHFANDNILPDPSRLEVANLLKHYTVSINTGTWDEALEPCELAAPVSITVTDRRPTPRLRFTIKGFRLRSSTCSEDLGDLMETALATYAALSKNLKEDDDEV